MYNLHDVMVNSAICTRENGANYQQSTINIAEILLTLTKNQWS